jgi:hypothetical protein
VLSEIDIQYIFKNKNCQKHRDIRSGSGRNVDAERQPVNISNTIFLNNKLMMNKGQCVRVGPTCF